MSQLIVDEHDQYALSVAVYRAIKRMGNEVGEVPMEKKRAEANLKKPMSVQAVPKLQLLLARLACHKTGTYLQILRSNCGKRCDKQRRAINPSSLSA